MRRISAAIMRAVVSMFGMSEAIESATQSTKHFGFELRSTKNHKSKPNKVSQKKRRLYARRLGKFK